MCEKAWGKFIKSSMVIIQFSSLLPAERHHSLWFSITNQPLQGNAAYTEDPNKQHYNKPLACMDGEGEWPFPEIYKHASFRF